MSEEMRATRRDPSVKQGIAAGTSVGAAIILATLGVVSLLQGIAAVAEDEIFVVGVAYTYEFDVTTWGWIHIVVGALMILIGAITMMGTSYHASCFVGINRGAGDNRFVMMVDLICGWLVVLPLTYLAAFVLPLPAAVKLPVVFLCTRIDQCFKWIIAFIRLRGKKWIKQVTR